MLLIANGFECGAATGLVQAMERLHKSCRRPIRSNPLLRYANFEAQPAGIRAMLPHVAEFLPAHNLRSPDQLAGVLAGHKRIR